ncbi:hypothetical protein, partial [Metapseudomonas otitidis]|uniref:hypothetical protein n=1 Tax=Metapseudomonas otitidis TaxID=319939 RepID=UPI001AAEBC4D
GWAIAVLSADMGMSPYRFETGARVERGVWLLFTPLVACAIDRDQSWREAGCAGLSQAWQRRK